MTFISLRKSNFGGMISALQKANGAIDNAKTVAQSAKNSLSMEVLSREHIENRIQSGIQIMNCQGTRVSSLKQLTQTALDQMTAADQSCAKKTSSTLKSANALSGRVTTLASSTAAISHHTNIADIVLPNRSNNNLSVFGRMTEILRKWVSKNVPNGKAIIDKNGTAVYVYTDKAGNVNVFKDQKSYEKYLADNGLLPKTKDYTYKKASYKVVPGLTQNSGWPEQSTFDGGNHKGCAVTSVVTMRILQGKMSETQASTWVKEQKKKDNVTSSCTVGSWKGMGTKEINCGNKSPEEQRKILYDSVTKGEPVSFQVHYYNQSKKKNSQHYLVAVGIREGADRNHLTDADILIIDTYDGKLSTLDDKKWNASERLYTLTKENCQMHVLS